VRHEAARAAPCTADCLSSTWHGLGRHDGSRAGFRSGPVTESEGYPLTYRSGPGSCWAEGARAIGGKSARRPLRGDALGPTGARGPWLAGRLGGAGATRHRGGSDWTFEIKLWPWAEGARTRLPGRAATTPFQSKRLRGSACSADDRPKAPSAAGGNAAGPAYSGGRFGPALAAARSGRGRGKRSRQFFRNIAIKLDEGLGQNSRSRRATADRRSPDQPGDHELRGNAKGPLTRRRIGKSRRGPRCENLVREDFRRLQTRARPGTEGRKAGQPGAAPPDTKEPRETFHHQATRYAGRNPSTAPRRGYDQISGLSAEPSDSGRSDCAHSDGGRRPDQRVGPTSLKRGASRAFL